MDNNSYIDRLLAEADQELGIDKEANDANGAPDNASNQEQGGGDIVTTAQALLQKMEQFKTALSQNAAGGAGAGQVQPDPATDPNAVQDPNAQVNNADSQAAAAVPPAAPQNSPVIITRPDGTQIKLASLSKLASVRGSKLFSEVK